jgi:hypothetical protein
MARLRSLAPGDGDGVEGDGDGAALGDGDGGAPVSVWCQVRVCVSVWPPWKKMA